MRMVVVLALLVGCVQSTSKECESGTPYERLCANTAICDDTHHLCVEQSQLDACMGIADGATCTANTVPGLCRDGVCLPPTCGDGFATAGEECDGSDLGSASDCTSVSFYDPSPLSCKADCTYDKSQCLGYCGDGLVDPRYELCDGAPPAESCIDLGYGAGALGCRACGPTLESCRYFGWHTPVVTPHLMLDVSAVDDTHVYAVGVHGVVYRFDGNGWGLIDISSCFPTFDMSELDSVHALAADDVWIGGDDFTTNTAIAIHVTSTGCTKYNVTSGATEVRQIFALSDTDVYAAVFSSLYHYDGAAWTMVDATAASYVWASGPSDVYAAAYNGTSLRHLSSGTWQTESLPVSLTVTSIWGQSASDVYVGGENGTGPYAPAVLLHWMGSSWTDISPTYSATAPITTQVTSIGFANNRLFIGIAGQLTGKVFEYDGKGWADLSMPTHYGLQTRIALTASGKMYATEGMSYLHRFEGTAESSTSWTYGQIFRLIAQSANAAYAAAGSSLYLWDGLTWTQDTGSGGVNDIWVDGTGTVYAAQSGAVRKRTAPNTWAVVDSVGATRIWGFTASDIWTVSANKQSFQHWDGASTTVCASCTTTSTNINDLWGASPTDIFAVGDLGHIWHWNGTSWSPMTSGTGQHLRAVWGSASNDVVAIGDLGTVLRYDGTSWSDMAFPTKIFSLNSVWGTGVNELFVATSAGELYRFDGSRWSPVDASAAGGAINAMAGAGDTMFLVGLNFARFVRTVAW